MSVTEARESGRKLAFAPLGPAGKGRVVLKGRRQGQGYSGLAHLADRIASSVCSFAYFVKRHHMSLLPTLQPYHIRKDCIVAVLQFLCVYCFLRTWLGPWAQTFNAKCAAREFKEQQGGH